MEATSTLLPTDECEEWIWNILDSTKDSGFEYVGDEDKEFLIFNTTGGATTHLWNPGSLLVFKYGIYGKYLRNLRTFNHICRTIASCIELIVQFQSSEHGECNSSFFFSGGTDLSVPGRIC
jgi:hypothetical protein